VHVLKDLKVLIPSAFTPNGDNINDEFFITTKYITSIQMIIMNRWNQVVYETNDLNFRWNGVDKSGKSCPEGVYTYFIKARDFENQLFEFSGTVTLIR
jgi:gliding motility-associated-like protein